jgi:hypothetical protein
MRLPKCEKRGINRLVFEPEMAFLLRIGQSAW